MVKLLTALYIVMNCEIKVDVQFCGVLFKLYQRCIIYLTLSLENKVISKLIYVKLSNLYAIISIGFKK